MAALTSQTPGFFPLSTATFSQDSPVYTNAPKPRWPVNASAAALAYLAPGTASGSGTTFPVPPVVTKVPVQP